MSPRCPEAQASRPHGDTRVTVVYTHSEGGRDGSCPRVPVATRTSCRCWLAVLILTGQTSQWSEQTALVQTPGGKDPCPGKVSTVALRPWPSVTRQADCA